MLELDPGVGEAVLGGEERGVVGGARVARVGVAEDEDGVADGVGVDLVGDLLDVGCACALVAVFGAVDQWVLASIPISVLRGF